MRTAINDSCDPMLLLTIVAAVLYFLFQIIFINSALTLSGDCLYTFWLPARQSWISPYWGFSFLVAVLVLWSLVVLVKKLFTKHREWTQIAYYAFAVFVLGCWAYELTFFWQTMEYERGAISSEEYYRSDSIYPALTGVHWECKSDIQ